MFLRSRMRKLVATGACWLRRSPIQHGMMFSQSRIIVIHHRHRTVVASVSARVQRTEAKHAFFQRDIVAVGVPGNECLAVAAIYPGTFSGEVVAESVCVRAFAANHNPTGAWHREVRVMFEAMNFYDVCEHWWLVVGSRLSVSSRG